MSTMACSSIIMAFSYSYMWIFYIFTHVDYSTWAMGAHKKWEHKENCCIILWGDLASSSNVLCHQSKKLSFVLILCIEVAGISHCMEILVCLLLNNMDYFPVKDIFCSSINLIWSLFGFFTFTIGWRRKDVWESKKRRKHRACTKADLDFQVWHWAKLRWQVLLLLLQYLYGAVKVIHFL